MKKRIFTLLISLLPVCLNACGMISGNGNSSSLIEFQTPSSVYGKEETFTIGGNQKKIKNIGTLTINRFDKGTGKYDPINLSLKKNGSEFYAETKVFESSNKDKSFFDESYLNLGFDKHSKGLNLELSLRF